MIFKKAFEDITFEDIQELVDKKVPESWVLDYKRQFDSKEAARLISAMANTYGGFVVYGVDTKKDSNEPREVVGIDTDRLEDSIDSLCYDAIDPPVFCQGKYVTNGDGKKVFIVQVPESDLTPHAVENGTTVYVKVNAQKRPFEKATLERQEWLKDRRLKHEDLRNHLMRDASKRVQIMDPGLTGTEFQLQVSLVPTYPRRALVAISQLEAFLRNFQSDLYSIFPGNIIGYSKRTAFDQGIVYHREFNGNRSYIEFGSLGLFHWTQFIPKHGDKNDYLYPEKLAHELFFMSIVGLKVLEKLVYQGSIRFSISIYNIANTMLLPDNKMLTLPQQGADFRCVLENSLGVESVLPYGQRSEAFRDAFQQFITRLAFIYGASGDLIGYGQSLFTCLQASYEKQASNEKVVTRNS